MNSWTGSNSGPKQSDRIVAGMPLPARFTYRRWIMTLCFIVVTAAVFLFAAFIYRSGREQAHEMGMLYFIGGVFCLLMTVVVLLGSSDVVVDESGLSWQVARLTWKQIQWSEVQRVRVREFPDYAQKCDVTTYVFEIGKSHFLHRGSCIDENIENYGAMLRLLNYFIEKYHIPINSEIKGSEGPIARL